MFPIPDAVRQCVETFAAAGFAAYPVGGCVRDSLLGRTPEDWDITTAAPPHITQALFPKTVPTGLAHGTVTVLLDGRAMEVTTFRGESGYSDSRHPDRVTFGVTLEEDLARRDFTINAMAMTLSGEILDPFGGQADLQKKRICAVGNAATRFTEDALRMFRAVRFSAQLGFDLDEAILAAIPPLAHRAKFLAGERIKIEVEKTLLSDHPHFAALFFSLGLLSALDPPSFRPLSALDPPSPRPLSALTPPDLAPLLTAERTPKCRWRTFCALTGFDITSLPVERRVRNAVLYPEREAVKTLALQGKDLIALGYEGEAVGKAQKALAFHVLAHPEDNEKSKLLEILRDLPL